MIERVHTILCVLLERRNDGVVGPGNRESRDKIKVEQWDRVYQDVSRAVYSTLQRNVL